ncbi:MAG: AIR synthase-related protein [Pseudomonadales bacterium]
MNDQPAPTSASPRYMARGVSAEKQDVHAVVDHLDRGLYPGSFCKVTEDVLGGSQQHCNVIHADGSGTKSILAYLQYKETGDPSVFYGTAQDSIVMNLDDLICVGATDNILISNTINRNARNCPGEVVKALIDGSEAFMQTMRDLGVNLIPGGGETADVGDLTGTLTVDSNAVVRMPRAAIVKNHITPDLTIIGLSAFGQCQYETEINSGIGSNGLTSARHDLLSQFYAEHYPETYDPNTPADLAYCGPYRLADALPGPDAMTVGEALLSPTRSYAPVVKQLLGELGSNIKGLIHCSGGALTKCLKFGQNVHYIKDHLFAVPPVFSTIQAVSKTSDQEMHQVFNMGHRLEVYVPFEHAQAVIDTAKAFQIEAQIIGRTEGSTHNQLTLKTHAGQTLTYGLTN